MKLQQSQVMTSGWGLRCSDYINNLECRVPDVLQGIESSTTTSGCPPWALLHPAKFCVDAPSGKTSCNVSFGQSQGCHLRFRYSPQKYYSVTITFRLPQTSR